MEKNGSRGVDEGVRGKQPEAGHPGRPVPDEHERHRAAEVVADDADRLQLQLVQRVRDCFGLTRGVQGGEITGSVAGAEPEKVGNQELGVRLQSITDLVPRRGAARDAVQQQTEAGRPARTAYQLNTRGHALAPVVNALIRWGALYMVTGPEQDIVDERWAVLALRAMLDGSAVRRPIGQLRVRCGGNEFTVVIGREGRRVVDGASGEINAVLTAPLPALLAAVSLGHRAPEAVIEGDASFAWAALAPDP